VLPFRQSSRSTASSRGRGDRGQRLQRRQVSSGTGDLRSAPVPAFGPPDPDSRPLGFRDQGQASRGSIRPGQHPNEDLRPRRAGPRLATDPFSPSPSGAPKVLPGPGAASPAGLAVFGTDGHLLAITQERRELVCSVIGLMVKLGLVAVAGVSLVRLAGAYQQRMDRNGEIVAVLELEKARLSRARERFDRLFMVAGEQRLIREQSQWIAPNRLRVVWQSPPPATSAASTHP